MGGNLTNFSDKSCDYYLKCDFLREFQQQQQKLLAGQNFNVMSMK